MVKHLLFYWYVPEKGWNKIYDLHIDNLHIYKDSFDKVTFIISTDDIDTEDYKNNINYTVDKLKSVFSDAEFKEYRNDKKTRESAYFYGEVLDKLDEFPENEILFFAHNKGVDSWYAGNRLTTWINMMYFANLHDVKKIKSYFDMETVCCAGTYTIMNLKAWNFLKYMWHYSGTFFWISPSRLSKYIKESKEKIPPIGRYSTEGLLGSILPNDDKYRIALYGRAREVHLGNTWIKDNMPQEDILEYEKLYGKLELTTGRTSPIRASFWQGPKPVVIKKI